jgi:AraC-like DNA-binding protein
MQFVHTVFLASLIIGLLIILILLIFAKRHNNPGNIYLALSLFSIVYLNMITNLNISQKVLEYPYLLRTGNIFSYLIYPFLFLYIYQTFYPQTGWKRINWLLFLPVSLYIIDLWPFFFLPSEEKIAIMAPKLSDFKVLMKVDEGWIGIPMFHAVFRYVWSLVIFIMIAVLVYRNRYLNNAREASDNKILFRFILTINLFYLPMIFPGIFGAIGRSNWYTYSFTTLNLSFALLTIGLFLLFFPHILYGFSVIKKPYSVTGDIRSLIADENQSNLSEGTSLQDRVMEQEIKNGKPSVIKGISDYEESQMLEKIKEALDGTNGFRNAGYSIHDLSRDSGIPVYLLSPLINHNYGDNFNNFINERRITYFIALLRDPRNRKLTLEALSRDAGFTSRSTFINAFRKRTGVTPGMYLKMHFSKAEKTD